MENKNLRWFFAMLFITVVPAAAIYWFNQNNTFEKSAAPKPWFPMGVSANGDSIYHQVPIFQAMNADSHIISTANMDGNISVVEFFFTECPSICPIMNKQMSRVFSELAGNDRIRVFSYSIDPERDNLAKLKVYADNHNADLTKWYFLNSNIDSLISFANAGIRVPAQDTMLESGDIPHTDRFALVDWNRNIRGYYTGTDSISVNKMMNDIVILLSLKDRIDKKALRNKNN
jgi:protein SCO1